MVARMLTSSRARESSLVLRSTWGCSLSRAVCLERLSVPDLMGECRIADSGEQKNETKYCFFCIF